ncbi:hypothetical protein P0136_06595 [Lentisphaerota bacterium ZTH]|nr:hypothetical protein JYG24_02295 [Lentisphaerota bacterium]WET07658.1 hypothetical protein P0136_06595 [Lentisphaerota bacterium ZTH]
MTIRRNEPIRVTGKYFSWSTAREKHFEFCPRAYFYQYYAAAGGFEKYSAARQLYKLKHLTTVPFWIKSLLGECLRDWFYDVSGDIPPEKVMRRLLSWRFRKGIKSLSLQEWREDSKKLNLFEHYYEHSDLGDILESVTAALTTAAKKLFQSGLIARLEKVDQVNKVIFNPPLETNLGALKLWFAADLVWQEDGKVNFLNILVENESELSAVRMVLHRLYAMHQLKLSPDKVQSFGFLPSNGIVYRFDDSKLNVSECINHIKDSSAKLLQLHTDELREEEFIKSGNNCDNCRFQEFCRNRSLQLA